MRSLLQSPEQDKVEKIRNLILPSRSIAYAHNRAAQHAAAQHAAAARAAARAAAAELPNGKAR